MKKLLLILLCVPLISLGQSWQIQYLANGYDFNTIYFYNDTIGFAVGDNGAMVKTTDAGNNWVNISTGITKDITDIQFISQDTGYMCTEGEYISSASRQGELLETIDGGLTWSSVYQYSSNNAIYSFYKIKGIENGNVILIGSYYNGSTSANISSIDVVSGIRTTLWSHTQRVYFDVYNYSSNSYTLVSGTSLTSGGTFQADFIRTSISGLNVPPNYPTGGIGASLYSIDMMDANPINGITVGKYGKIYNLTNMTSVNNVITENSSFTNTLFDLWSVDMMNDKGWIVGDLGTILFTVDSGQTWTQYNNPILFEDLHSVTFLDPCRGYFAGENGIIGRYNYQEEVSATICEDVQNYNLFNLLGSNAINLGGVWTDSSGNPISSMVNASNYSLGMHTFYYNYLACGSMTSSIVELEIVENPNLNILVLNNISCNGGNDGMLQVNMNNGSIIYANSLWSNGVSSPIFQNASAGQYSVQVTDTNGCSSTEVINMVEPSLIVSNPVVTDISCSGLCDGQIDINNVSGGIAPYVYLWGNGVTSLSLSSLCAGTYHYSITDANGCLSSDSVIVNEPMPIFVNSTVSNITCFGGNDGGISVTPNGGTSPFSVLWNTSDTNFIINNLSTGLYTYTLIDNNNCSYSGSIQITEPALNVSNIQPVECFGGSFSVGSNTYSSSGVFSDTLTSFIGCDSIVVTNLVISPLNIVQNTISLCDGETVSVGSNIYTTSGNYTDTLTASNSCDSIVYTNISITPAVIWQQSFSICDGDNVIVGNSVYDTTGNYTDTLTASNSCDSIVYTNIIVDYNTSSYDTLSVTASIVWNGIPLSLSGDYSITLINSVGCDSIVNLNLTITNSTSVEENTNNKELIKITNVLGQETPYRKNTPLFYIYNDGTVEKKIIIE